ncbi:dienelactone hydrolase family protein [Klebsiella oxytoca]|uniref:dienelactone hydrolase family protein n=1 Tax=Klebsiella oxytoca TaxID=571 RepID=UPI000D65DC43|nr:dienelactone hydrolase family protein [Klebsiella oxytoca]
MLPECDKAIILLHEIYGINAHIQRTAATWRSRGFDVYTPALFPHSAPFAYEQQEQAWRHFNDNVGFDTTAIESLLAELKTKYGMLILIGYSVGATLAWLAARSDFCNAAICHYGSRIRHYSDVAPPCPTLVILASEEPAFDPRVMQDQLENVPSVTCRMFNAQHGFCDADSPAWDPRLTQQADEDSLRFLTLIQQRQET